METIEIDFDKKDELMQLPVQVKKHKLTLGKDQFKLKVFISYDISDTSRAAYIFFIANLLKNGMKGPKAAVTGYLENINTDLTAVYYTDYSFTKLKKAFEKAFKLNIELEKKSPLEAAFGMWKDEDIDIDKIRKKAWQRTN